MTKEHPFADWHYLVLNGRMKKRLDNPLRERVLVRKALSTMGMRYREQVVFRNPLYGGWKGKVKSAPQWLDFVIFYRGRMYVLLFKLRRINQGVHRRERESYQAKLEYLKQRRTPYLILNRTDTSQEYKWRIETFLRKEQKENENHKMRG